MRKKKILTRKILMADKKAIGFQLIKCLSIKNIDKQRKSFGRKQNEKCNLNWCSHSYNGIKINFEWIHFSSLFPPPNNSFLFLPWKNQNNNSIDFDWRKNNSCIITMGFCSVHRLSTYIGLFKKHQNITLLHNESLT